MKIYFATWMGETAQGKALTKARANKRLLSFHFLQTSKVTKEEFLLYAKLGRIDLKKHRERKK